MELNLKGKRALITGGSKGIGLAIKKALEAEGVIVTSWSRTEGVDLMRELPSELPNIDILINNFGGGGTWKQEDYKQVMHNNYFVTNELTMRFLEQNKLWGRVITISSIYGTYAGHNAAFTSAKSAQIMLMKSLAQQHKGITFNCVSPAEVSDAGTPKKVNLKAQDVANLVVFLCSEKALNISGQNIVIGECNNAI